MSERPFDRAFDFLHVNDRPDKPREKGIAEEVHEWRTDVVYTIANELGMENCVFEAPGPEMFEWYIKNFGPNVNLFVDNSQIVELECMRSGLWGKTTSWGRTTTYSRE
nr:phosphosulfolactate synthase [Halococcus agarilyticus]